MTITENQIKVMKLSSGEEIVSELIADEHPRTFNVKSPLKILSIPKVGQEGIEESISLQRWIHFAEENNVDIPKAQVLAIVNASFGLCKFYEYCVNKMNLQESEDVRGYDTKEFEEEYLSEEEELLDEWEPESKLVH